MIKDKMNYARLMVAVVLIIFSGCHGGNDRTDLDTEDSGTIHISVDESFKPVIDSQIQVFEALYPRAKIIAEYKPEAQCFRDLIKDSTRMIIVTRGLTDEELRENNLSDSQVSVIENYLKIEGTNDEKLDQIGLLLGNVESGQQGIEELRSIFGFLKECGAQSETSKINIDLTLARGLDYYTGIIYEVKARNVNIGSIGGGGRYDDLTGLFGLPGIPGVGISFGVDRIYDVMDELNIFPGEVNKSTTVLFFNLGENESRLAFKEMQILRNEGISCEIFYENAKMDKQFKYASKKNIPCVVIIGSNELEQQTCVVKDLVKGEQETIPLRNISSYFRNKQVTLSKI